MKKTHDLLGVILAVITGVLMLAAMVINAFLPRIILPKPNANTIITICLAALVLDYYLARTSKRSFIAIPIYGALIFGLFPLAAFYASPVEAVKLAVLGAVAFTVTTWLFDTITDRLASSPQSKLSPLVSALGLFLASQCLMGII